MIVRMNGGTDKCNYMDTSYPKGIDSVPLPKINPTDIPPAHSETVISGKVQRILMMMENTSLGGKTGILYDVMIGLEKGHWTVNDARIIANYYRDLVSETLNFMDGGVA